MTEPARRERKRPATADVGGSTRSGRRRVGPAHTCGRVPQRRRSSTKSGFRHWDQGEDQAAGAGDDQPPK